MSALIPDLRIARPPSVKDAIAALCESPSSQFIAGGTDLLVSIRHGLSRPDLLIDLSGIEELAEIKHGDQGLRIGAGVTLAALARTPIVAARYGAMAQAATAIAGPGHRVLGTVGGNLCLDTRCIYYNQSEWWRAANRYCLKRKGDTCHVAPQAQHCHAAFTGDLAPALLALGAEVEIADTGRIRRVPLDELYVEDGRAHLTLARNELLVAVHLPPDPPQSAYRKVRVRGAIDYPLAGVAVALHATAGVMTSLKIALTGTNSRPFTLVGTDTLLGRRLDAASLRDIDRMVQKQVRPMRTTIVSAQYRRLAVAALAARLTEELFQQRSHEAVSAVT